MSNAQHGAGTVGEEAAQVGIAALRDAPEPSLVAARPFSGSQPKVAGKVPRGGEALHITHEGNEGGSGQEADAGNGAQVHHGWNLLAQQRDEPEKQPAPEVKQLPVKFDFKFSGPFTHENLTIFLGVNGPYWTDLNGNNDIDEGETNPDAIGLAINDADFALALLRPKLQADTTRYVGLKARADQIAFVGTDVFQFNASLVVVDLNLATGSGTEISCGIGLPSSAEIAAFIETATRPGD